MCPKIYIAYLGEIWKRKKTRECFLFKRDILKKNANNLKEMRNSFLCVTPKNHRLMFGSWNYYKHFHKKSNCVFL